MRALVIAACLLVGCDDVPQPFDLDHARVMAVRIDPPALAPEDRARIDVLVTDSSAQPRIADPATVTVEAVIGVTVGRDDDGWFATAPTAAQLTALRVALGVADGADVVVPLALTIATVDGVLPAQKTLALGTRADNPAAPAITLDGAVGALVMTPGRDAALAVAPSVAALSYRWFSSVGDLTGYTRAEARLDPVRGAEGHVVVVVRDQVGGTAWTIATASVLP